MVNFNIRMSDELHAALKAAAARDRRSLQGQILWFLERGIGTVDTPGEPVADTGVTDGELVQAANHDR